MPQMLRFVAVHGPNGGPMVPVYESLAVCRRQFVGRRLDPAQGKPFVHPDTKQPMRHAVFVAHEDDAAIHEVAIGSEFVQEYLRHIKDGDLLPADAFTAAKAGVGFDPTLAGAALWGLPDEKAEAQQPTIADVHAAAVQARQERV